MREKPLLKTPVWIVFIIIIAAVCCVPAIVIITREKNATEIVEVCVDGEVVYSVDLSQVEEPFEKEILSPYGSNTLYVSRGGVRMLSADCRDELCVRQGELRKDIPIACLPHHLTVRYKKSGDVDAVSR